MAVEFPPGLEEDDVNLSEDIGGDTPPPAPPFYNLADTPDVFFAPPLQFQPPQDFSGYSPEQLSALRFQQQRELGTIGEAPESQTVASAMMEPFVKLPRYEGMPGMFPGEQSDTAETLGGIYNTLAGFTEGFTSPAAILTMGLGGAARPLANRLLAAGWAGEMGRGIPEQAVDVYEAYKLGLPLREKIQRPLGLLGSALLTGTTVKEAIHPDLILPQRPRVELPESQRALAELPVREGGEPRAQEERTQAQRDVLAETGEAPSLPTTETPDAIQQEANEPVRGVPEQPREDAGPVPGQEVPRESAPGAIPPGDEGGAPRAEEARQPEVPLTGQPGPEQLSRIQDLEMKVHDEFYKRGSESPDEDLLSITEGRHVSPDQYEAGLRKMLDQLSKGASPELLREGYQKALPEVAEERFQREEGAGPAKPEIARQSASTSKNTLGDPLGSTYHGTPEDFAAYQKVQADIAEAMKAGDMDSAMKLWKENERIKNKYGGMPPEAPKPSERALTEASPFEHKEYVKTDASGGAVLDLEKFGKDLAEGKIKGGEAANQLLSHLLKPDPNHPLKAIKILDLAPAELAALTGKVPYKGRFTLDRGERAATIEVLTRDAQGNPISHQQLVQTLNHELTHNAVDSKYDSAPEEVKKAWREAYDQAKRAAEGTDLAGHNAFTSDREFLAEASSSPRIQSFLASQLKEGAKGPLTLKNSKWGQVLDTMRRILKLPEFLKAKGKSVDTITLLDETMRISGELEQVRREAKAAAETRLSPEERVTPEQEKAFDREQLGIIHPAFRSTLEFMQDLPTNMKVASAQLAGKSAPRTSTASVDSGNSLVRYASSKIAAPVVAKSMATEVLGTHHQDPAFGAKLGAVLVEDRLRAIEDGLTKAGDQQGAAMVNSIIGQKDSPLQTEADFQAALADPEIKAAIDRHKQTVQPAARSAHLEAGGKLAGPGLNTGAFVNLKAIFEGGEEALLRGGGRGNLQNPLRRPSKFAKTATGTAQKYEVDYRTIAQRMIEGNFEESAKRKMYSQLVKDGLAVMADPSDPRPEIGGKPAVKFQIERKGVPAGEGKARTYVKNLWVRADIAPEVRQALNVDGPVQKAGIVQVANLLNKIQLAGPTDAVWHTANSLGSIAGSQGGRTLLIDLARKLPGVNIGDAIGRTVASSIRVLRDSPEVQKQLADLARIGALRERSPGTGPLAFTHNVLTLVDRAARLVRNDMFNNLVKRGLETDTEARRREWVNQIGNYNGRLMGQFQRFFKEAGFSPFIVAGRNFNRMAMRRLTLDPGTKGASPAAAAQMRAVEFFGTAATLFAIPAFVNYVITGSPTGRPGTKMGQIDTGKDKDGRHIVIDPAQWTGLRRGLRISGIDSVVEGLREGKRGKRITQEAIRDILGGIIHPWAGPAVTAGSVAATGYTPSMYKESEDPSDYGENVKKALQQLNPVVNAIIKGGEESKGGTAGEKVGAAAKQLGLSLGGAAGVKTVPSFTSRQHLANLHSKWLSNNADPKVKADFERNETAKFPLSKYRDLDKAMKAKDEKAVLTAIQELRPLVKDDQAIYKRMSPYSQQRLPGSSVPLPVNKPFFHESRALENKFLASLSPKERALYDQALKDRQEEWALFLRVWAQRGARPTP